MDGWPCSPCSTTGQGPVENWASHIDDPFAVNGLSISYARSTPVGPCWELSAV